MPVALTERAHTIRPANRRSPTQRHMHNYSLPSPSFAGPRPTTPLSTRCRSSPTLSEFRKAIYIPRTICDTVDINGGPSRDKHIQLPNRSGHTTRPTEARGISDAPHTVPLRGAASDPGISLLAYMNDEEQIIVSPTPALSLSCSYSSFLPPTPPPTPSTSSPRLCTSPLRPRKLNAPKPNRLSLASLSFPVPASLGLTSDVERGADPSISPSYASATNDLPQSKWSPTSSTLSLAHQVNASDVRPKKDHGAFERLKSDIPSPTKLKQFFGRLSISRNPATSGFHFRSASKQEERRNSRLTFVVVNEEKPDDLGSPIENTMSTHWKNDRADIRGNPHVEQQDFCFVLTEELRLDTEGDSPTSVYELSTENRPESREASNPKYIDVDGIVTEHSSISDSIQFPLPAQCLHVSSSHTLATMRAPVSDVATSTDLPSLSSPGHLSRTKPSRLNTSRAFAIPPSPRVPPPHPPKSPPPYASDSVDNPLAMGFPSPPTPARYSSSASPASARETQMERCTPVVPPSPSTRPLPRPPTSLEISSLHGQNPNYYGSSVEVPPPPAIPPRSRLRPPPVKITTDFSQYRTIREDSEERDVWPLERASPAHLRSASIASFTISPLSTPPLHSRSSSTGSPKAYSMPTPSHHSHSSSVASSLVISPMPTPPPLSPTSPLSSSGPAFPPLALPRGNPVTQELDMGALRALILRRAGRTFESDRDREVGESLEAIALAHKRDSGDYEDSSTCTGMTPEFAWQEEPRPPPSRLSFYESAEPIHASSDPGEEDQDDAASIYSQFSSTYTFRSRTKSTMRMRSLRRNGSTGRMSRRMAATSMMSVYSQASFSSQDAMDMPPVPSLPWGLRGDLMGDVAEGSIAEHDLGEMTFNAPEYAYAYSLDDYVGHGLEGVALAGRTAVRSGEDFEAALPRHNSRPSGDWRALLTAQDNEKAKRRTSSNISVVGNVFASEIDPEVTPVFAFTDVGSVATNGSIGDISTTSTLMPISPVSTGNSPVALVPNRRQRTIRRVATTLPSPRQPPSSTSVNFVFDTETGDGGWRREVSFGETLPFPSVGPQAPLTTEDKVKKARGMRSGLQGMRSRVNVLKSRLVSLTLAPRSPSSASFSSGRSAELNHHPGLNPYLSPTSPSANAHSPTSVSPSVSPSSSSGGSLSTPSSVSSWTPGLTTGDGLFLSPTAAPSTVPMAI
ncbi:hypothetical protein B0H17DRAFT_613342 [Mycena rosella]|uniref:Uncharacterized protein n=1 Tax=Mycena rosella TaxID=1033263 RepID=A0AAD7GVC9_MYCRO|nr:hypothetical protein B0H17DRAFT_613342 [Mycena rosella]